MDWVFRSRMETVEVMCFDDEAIGWVWYSLGVSVNKLHFV
jgi:hypothetical protein